jgi:hypothetical protein
MAGYEPKAKTYRLKFEDHPGLEVDCESLTIGEFLSVSALADTLGEESGAAAEKSVTELLSVFAEHLISWNVIKRGRKVPATLDGVRGQHFDFVMEIILAWMGAIASVDPTLLGQSSDGATSPVPSIPMEPLSPSPEN